MMYFFNNMERKLEKERINEDNLVVEVVRVLALI